MQKCPNDLLSSTSRGVQHPTTPPSRPEAVSVDETARLFGLSRTKIYELISNGTLPSIRIGRRRLVRVEAIQTCLAVHERRSG